jgi:hypothetical protein
MSIIAWLFEQLGAAVVYGGAGLLVGWNVLPQPAFVKKYYDKAVAAVKAKLA